MSDLIRICSAGELPGNDSAREFDAGGRAICVANVDGQWRALDNICPHRGGPLAEGTIENGHLVCPWHAWEFDPKTGECVTFGGGAVAVYPITIRAEDVYIEI